MVDCLAVRQLRWSHPLLIIFSQASQYANARKVWIGCVHVPRIITMGAVSISGHVSKQHAAVLTQSKWCTTPLVDCGNGGALD